MGAQQLRGRGAGRQRAADVGFMEVGGGQRVVGGGRFDKDPSAAGQAERGGKLVAEAARGGDGVGDGRPGRLRGGAVADEHRTLGVDVAPVQGEMQALGSRIGRCVAASDDDLQQCGQGRWQQPRQAVGAWSVIAAWRSYRNGPIWKTSSAITGAERPVIHRSPMIALRVAFPTTPPSSAGRSRGAGGL